MVASDCGPNAKFSHILMKYNSYKKKKDTTNKNNIEPQFHSFFSNLIVGTIRNRKDDAEFATKNKDKVLQFIKQ